MASFNVRQCTDDVDFHIHVAIQSLERCRDRYKDELTQSDLFDIEQAIKQLINAKQRVYRVRN